MKKMLLILALIFGTAVTIVGSQLPRPDSQASTPGPAEVVQAFYGDYLSYIGEGEAMRNPLVDGMYRRSPSLAEALIVKVDELLAGFEKGGFDPFLLAQDVPAEVTAGAAVVVGETATVPVTTSFHGHRFTVSLEKQADGRWLITAITPEK
jgi:hypothetical protein